MDETGRNERSDSDDKTVPSDAIGALVFYIIFLLLALLSVWFMV